MAISQENIRKLYRAANPAVRNPAVNSNNLFKKFCFLLYGCDFESNRELLKSDFYAFHRRIKREGAETISRQAILNWFKNDGTPERGKALLNILISQHHACHRCRKLTGLFFEKLWKR